MAFSAFPHCLCLFLFYLMSSVIAIDKASIGFENTSMTVPENIGQVTFCINFNSGRINSVAVNVFTTNPNKEDPVTSVGNFSVDNLVFTSINSSKCLNANVLKSSILEFGKVYFLNITIFNVNALRFAKYKENQRTLAITITDENTVSIGFSKRSLTVSESDGNVTVCMNRLGEARDLGGEGVPLEALSVRLSTVQGTAASNDDFTPLNSYLVDFGLNETFKCIDIPLSNDKQTEYTETFYIFMKNGSNYVIVNETRNNLTVNIMNDDKATAQFKEEYREIEENDENKVIELGCVIEPQSQIPLQIGFEIDGFSSTAVDSEDFIYNKSLTFPPGENRVSLQIKIIHDRVAESPEILVLRMISLNEDLVIIGKNNTAKVKIIDKFDNENEPAKQEQEKIENEKRNKVYTLLIVAIVLIALLFLCGIVVCVCFRIKSKQA